MDGGDGMFLHNWCEKREGMVDDTHCCICKYFGIGTCSVSIYGCTCMVLGLAMRV